MNQMSSLKAMRPRKLRVFEWSVLPNSHPRGSHQQNVFQGWSLFQRQNTFQRRNAGLVNSSQNHCQTSWVSTKSTSSTSPIFVNENLAENQNENLEKDKEEANQLRAAISSDKVSDTLSQGVWKVQVRDRVMIARNYERKASGSTLLVDAEFSGPHLERNNILIDIGLALQTLGDTVKAYNYKSLNEKQDMSLESFASQLRENIYGVIRERLGEGESIQLKISLTEPATGQSVSIGEQSLSLSVTSYKGESIRLVWPMVNSDTVTDSAVNDAVKIKGTVTDAVKMDLVRLQEVLESITFTTPDKSPEQLEQLWKHAVTQLRSEHAHDVKSVRLHSGATAITGKIEDSSFESLSVSHYYPIRVTHSFSGDVFGPAQALHGTSFGVTTTLELPFSNEGKLDHINAINESLRSATNIVLSKYDAQNLDEIDELKGINTTCEFMAERFWQEIVEAIQAGTPTSLATSFALTVSIKESDVATVQFTKDMPSVKANKTMIFENANAITEKESLTQDVSIQAVQDEPSTIEQSTVKAKPSTHVVTSLVFTGPEKVEIKTGRPDDTVQQKSMIQLESLYSLVSSGTELRLFENRFGEDEVVDEVFDKSVFGYPMKYGYQTVARVIDIIRPSALGESGISSSLEKGDLVFGFLPHQDKHFVEDQRSLIPLMNSDVEGNLNLDIRNYLFLPAMETALSIVHDASIKIGDRILIMGQGLIGNLVGSIINSQFSSSAGQLTLVDLEQKRLNVGSKFMKTRRNLNSDSEVPCFTPDELSKQRSTGSSSNFEYDTCIDLTGSASALNQCLDYVTYGGTIVIGSWSSANFHLNTKFHRNKVHIISSQVSRIPGRFSDTWDKERRLQTAKILCEKIKPYDVLLTGSHNAGSETADTQKTETQKTDIQPSLRTIAFSDADMVQRAYEMLKDKEVSVVMFDYEKETELQKSGLTFMSASTLPTDFGEFKVQIFKTGNEAKNDCAPLICCLSRGELNQNTENLILRIHDTCFTGETLSSLMCDCKSQLQKTQKMLGEMIQSDGIAEAIESSESQSTAGLILYTFQEGRGIGLAKKIEAYNLQLTKGLDTVEANLAVGCAAEERDYSFIRGLLFGGEESANNVHSPDADSPNAHSNGLPNDSLNLNESKLRIHLISNNPYKVEELEKNGVRVYNRLPIIADSLSERASRYLDQKKQLMNHIIGKENAPPTTLAQLRELKSSASDRCSPVSQNSSKNSFESLYPLLPTWAMEFMDYKREVCCSGQSNEAKPFVTLAYASGLDGVVGSKDKRLILSGTESLTFTHALRSAHDAIMVGIGTVLADNPKLTARLEEFENALDDKEKTGNMNDLMRNDLGIHKTSPIPIVIDPMLRTPINSNLVKLASERETNAHKKAPLERGLEKPELIIITNTGESLEKQIRRESLLCIKGVEIIDIDSSAYRFPLSTALEILHQYYSINSVMVEGGAEIINQLLNDERDSVNLVAATVAPVYHTTKEESSKCHTGGDVTSTTAAMVSIKGNSTIQPLATGQLGKDLIIVGKVYEPGKSMSGEHR